MKPRTAPLPDPIQGARWIPLTKELFALVDDEDYDRVSGFTWTAAVRKRTTYACRGFRENGKSKCELLHRFIMRATQSIQVDHIDGNGLNCRRSNMRVCTVKDNHRNLRTPVCLKPKTSRFKGVSYFKPRGKWVAKIHVNGKGLTLGYFDEEEAAARRYDEAAVFHFKEFSNLNFNAHKLLNV